MTFFVAFTKLVSFIREMSLAAAFGAGIVTDAYNMSVGVISILGIIFSSYLNNTFIPIYTEAGVRGGVSASNRFANNVLHITLFISVILCAACLAFPDLILRVMAPSFSDEQIAVTIPMLRFVSLSLPFTAISNTWANIQVSHHRFTAAQLITLPVSLCVIAACFLGTRGNPLVLGIAAAVGSLAQIFILLPFMGKTGYRYRLEIPLSDDLKKSLTLFIPVMLVTASAQINVMVDKMLASGLPVGSVASLEFANRLVNVCIGFVVAPLSLVLFPQFTELTAKGDWATVRLRFFKNVELLLLVTVPMTVITFICGTDIVRVVYERGSFDATATLVTREALIYYILALPFMALNTMLYRVFLAYQDTKTPTISSFIGLVTNTVASIILVRFMGIGGLALGTAIGSTIAPIILLMLLRKKRGKLGLSRFAAQLTRMAGCALACGLVTLLCSRLIPDISPYIRFPVCTVAGGGVYLIMAHFLSIESMKQAEGLLWKKLKPQRSG